MYSTVNKAKLGCFKDDTAGQMLEEIILLRPKMYRSMKYKDTPRSIKRAKGISKHVVKNMKHEHYTGIWGTENHTNTNDDHSIKGTYNTDHYIQQTSVVC